MNSVRSRFTSSLMKHSPISRRVLYGFVVTAVLFLLILGHYSFRGRSDLMSRMSIEETIDHHLKTIPKFYEQSNPIKELTTLNLGYSAVVLYLTSVNRLRELLLSLSDLHSNVNMHPWPIILMYTDDLDDERLRNEFMIRLYDFMGPGKDAREFMARIEWLRLEWHLPDNMSHDKAVVDPVFEYVWPGYHIMCGFFATQIFQLPRLKDVTYYMRLDTDSYIHEPLCYDPFARFHAHNRSYAFNTRTWDPSWVTFGLWDLLDDYARAHPEIENNLRTNNWEWAANREKGEMTDKDFPTYYNNFEIVKLEAFRRPNVVNWLEEIMKDPLRVYKYRWGDAPIRYATVQMFLDVEHDVEDFCAITYWHNGDRKHCDCTND